MERSKVDYDGIYDHDAVFNGIFVTQPARITKFIIPNFDAVYVPLGEVFAYAPAYFHDLFYHWQFQEGNGSARFISPLRYLLSAN
jgi:hypothetical protein